MRTNIVNENGEFIGWFDKTAARSWEEDQYHNGSNLISVNTGSQWEHQQLFLTKKGRWVLCEWSAWNNNNETYTEITQHQAHIWLLKNKEEVPQEFLDLMEV